MATIEQRTSKDGQLVYRVKVRRKGAHRSQPPYDHSIHPMQVLPGKCQGDETCDHQDSQSFILIMWVTDTNPDFAASLGSIHRFERTVADQHLVSVRCE